MFNTNFKLNHLYIFRVFKNFGWAITDFLRFSPDESEELEDCCNIKGLSKLDSTLERGKGVIIVAPHMGPWETAGAYLAFLGYKINAVALEHPSPRVTKFFSEKRKRWGVIDYNLKDSIIKPLKALNRGEIVVLLIDRNFTDRGVKVEFLGRETSMPYGHVILSKRTSSCIIPAYCYYDENNNIEIALTKPIELSGVENEETDIVRKCIEAIEEPIKRHYLQWFAFDHIQFGN